MIFRGLVAAALLALGSLAIAAAPAPQGVEVRQAWIRWLPANLPQAGYAVIVNDSDDTVRITGASSPDYGMVMLHQSRLAHGDSTMEAVKSLDVPAHGKVELSPGGYHLMLSHATRTIKPGDKVEIDLEFAGGASLQVEVPVLPANAQGPADGGGKGQRG